MPEMAARTSPFAPPAAKIPLALIVLQEAQLICQLQVDVTMGRN
jgi:hypothetical protein